jgi:hypothetical protein
MQGVTAMASARITSSTEAFPTDPYGLAQVVTDTVVKNTKMGSTTLMILPDMLLNNSIFGYSSGFPRILQAKKA